MAKPFEQRVQTALNHDGFCLAHFAPLIAEGEQLAERQRAIAARAQDESIDFALGVADREEAAQRADKAAREVAMLSGAIKALKAKLTERKASEKAQAAEAGRAAILARRDALAERFKAEVPPLIEALTSLLGEIVASDEEMRAARMPDISAEALARGIPRNWFVGGEEALRFTQIRLPAWAGHGRCWPKRELDSPFQNYGAQRAVEKKRAAEIRAKEAAKWGWFRLTPSGWTQHSFSYQLILPERGATGQVKQRGLFKSPWSGNIARAEAERLAELGVKVEEIDQATAEAEQIAREKESDERDGIYYRR